MDITDKFETVESARIPFGLVAPVDQDGRGYPFICLQGVVLKMVVLWREWNDVKYNWLVPLTPELRERYTEYRTDAIADNICIDLDDWEAYLGYLKEINMMRYSDSHTLKSPLLLGPL